MSEKRYADLLKMFLSERRDQSQYLADQLGVALPPLLVVTSSRTASVKNSEGHGTKTPCQGDSGETSSAAGAEAVDSPGGTTESVSSGDTVTAEVRPGVDFLSCI